MVIEKDTILYVLTKSQEYLKSKLVSSYRLDAELLLADTLKMNRVNLYTKFDQKLTEEQKNIYRDKIKQRGTHKPVAYILGNKNFYKYNFLVNENVLIPRPETEELVEWVLQENTDNEIEVLDLATGSGCIAICLSKERPNWKLAASDISGPALEVAKENIKLHNVQIEVIQSDLFKNLNSKKFSLIVSNPPYIPIEEKESLETDVKDFEPHLALFLNRPLEFYQNFLEQAKNFLEPQGKIYIETHHNWANIIQELAKKLSYKNIVIKKDLSHKERFIRLEL